MKRFLLLAAAVAVTISIVLPATAGAASWRGVVIAKDATRKALVTASRNGTVRTVRARTAFKKVGVGRVVAVQAAKLPDGTFSASAVKRLGKTRRAHFRAVVVVRRAGRLIVSAGGSVFGLRLRSKTAASTGGGLEPGDEVDCDAHVKGGGLESDEHGVEEVGHVDKLVLEGIYLTTADDGTIEFAVVHRGRVFVKVPDGVSVPDFQPGDEIALVVTVESDGSFTLIKAENENEAGDDESGEDDGVDIDAPKAEFSVVGILAAVSDESVAVKVEGKTEPVKCDVPEGFDLSDFEVGQRVYMACKYHDGHVTLLALKKKDTGPSGDYFSLTGTLTSLDSTHVTVQADGHDPVSCAVPAGWDLLGFAAGEEVLMYCWKTDQGFTLKALKSEHAMISPDGTSWFELEGTILDVNNERVSLQVGGHPSPVTCGTLPGADLSAFHVGDDAVMACRYMDGGFKLKHLKTDTAEYAY